MFSFFKINLHTYGNEKKEAHLIKAYKMRWFRGVAHASSLGKPDKGTNSSRENWFVSFLEHKIYIYYPPFYTDADRNLFTHSFLSPRRIHQASHASSTLHLWLILYCFPSCLVMLNIIDFPVWLRCSHFETSHACTHGNGPNMPVPLSLLILIVEKKTSLC